jgi:hypothetical protein
LIVAVARYGALVLQFGSLRLSDLDRWVAWVFLPAGVGVIAALVVGTRVFPGVMFGSFLWNLSGHPMPLIDNFLLSLAGGAAPYLSLIIFRRLKRFRPGEVWRNYRLVDIVGFSAVHAVLNSGLNHGVFLLPVSARHFAWDSLLASIVGDFSGGLALFVLLNGLMLLAVWSIRRP